MKWLTAYSYRGGRVCDDEVNIRRDCWNRARASFYLPNRGENACGNGTALKPMPGQLRWWDGSKI